jgi:hypothetical protein
VRKASFPPSCTISLALASDATGVVSSSCARNLHATVQPTRAHFLTTRSITESTRDKDHPYKRGTSSVLCIQARDLRNTGDRAHSRAAAGLRISTCLPPPRDLPFRESRPCRAQMSSLSSWALSVSQLCLRKCDDAL